MLKRMRKMGGLEDELAQPRFDRMPQAEATLVGWGSTYGAIREAADLLRREGPAVNILHLSELWPFPGRAVSARLASTPKSIVIENNATGQLAGLVREQTGIKVNGTILKFDGRPFSPEYILGELKKELS